MPKKFKVFIFLFVVILSMPARAETIIDISSGNMEPTPIAINAWAGHSHGDIIYGEKISKVIKDDLQNSGLFRAISPAAFIENKVGVNHKPLFAAWQQINANLLLNAEVQKLDSGKLKVKFILWDTILESELISETLELSETIWRRAGHKIADRIYKKITGYDGYFDTRIAYVSETGSYFKRVKRIAIMDQDGENHQYLTDGKNLVLTPRFSPDGKKLLYLSYQNRVPQVFILDLASGRSSLLGKFHGMSFAPQFSPDGKHVVVSIAKSGRTNIYEIELRSHRMKQLTNGSAIYTSPSYSPDGKEIVFQSDMDGGRRQLYIMNRDGSNIKRLTHAARSYAEPKWSINGYLAFTTVSREFGFTIGVLNLNSMSLNNNERLITKGYLVESPAWAPNGRVIVFAKGTKPTKARTSGLSRLYTIDFTGHNERLVPTPHDASDPDWSKPRL